MFPFTPTERALILAAAIAAILWAVWSVWRLVYLRSRRSAGEMYVRIGMILFLAVLGVQLIGVAEEWDFYTGNLRHILLLPGEVLAVCLFVLMPCAIIEERRKRAQATGQIVSAMSEEWVMRVARMYFWWLVGLLLLMPFGLYGQLFGPTWTIFIGPVGFVSAMALFMLSGAPIGKRFLGICPRGLSERFPALARSEILLRRLMKVVGIVATIALVTLMVAARWDGVAGMPVFAQRAHYALVSHSVSVEVSRLRYCIVGTAFHAAWYLGASFVILLSMNALMFAKIPKQKAHYARK